MATSHLHSKKTYRVIGAVLVIAVIVPVVYWFNYYRIADFEMRWMTGEQANFRSREPNFDRDGNPKILILWPDKLLHCYQASYSKDLLAYLQTIGPKRYLFSGLLKCSVCGGSIALVSGRRRHGADRYGCSVHHQRGDSVCENAALVRRDELEHSLLKGLADSVLRIEVIDYAVARMEQALRQGHEKLNAELERMRQRRQQIEGEIKRLVNAVAEGQLSQSLMAAIGERETELRTITNSLLEPGPDSLQATLDELRTFAVSRLTKIRELIAHPESVDLARAVLAEHFGTFTLEPTVQDGEPVYLAHGKVDFFGDEAMVRTGGAGGPACTILPQAKFFVDFAA